jgi:hypothetical protein
VPKVLEQDDEVFVVVEVADCVQLVPLPQIVDAAVGSTFHEWFDELLVVCQQGAFLLAPSLDILPVPECSVCSLVYLLGLTVLLG